MFSNWFSGDPREQYCVSSHKQRMDQVGNSLVELLYADEVLRQHLHECSHCVPHNNGDENGVRSRRQ